MQSQEKRTIGGITVMLTGTVILFTNVAGAQPAAVTVQNALVARGGCAGGLIGCATDTPYEGRCDPGFHRRECIVTTVKGNGNCFADRRGDPNPWLSNDPNDCRYTVHAGTANTKAVDCSVQITEEGMPPEDVTTTLLSVDFKRYNNHPLGPGCKNDSFESFTIPEGATLASITIGDHSCSAGGPDVPPGREEDTHRGLGNPVVGGMRITRRPADGAGPGWYQVYYHWWFNQWGSSEFHLCVNINHKRSVPIDTTTYVDHMNMDDGLKAYSVKTPLCVDKIGVKANIPLPPGSGESLSVDPDVSAKACNMGDLWWFGCKDDHGHVITW